MTLSWARMTLAALERSGVRDLVICPGSRSAALAIAAAESPLRKTAIIDERSAGFFALGQARASGRPSALICTSGTAGAHFYPAIIEASHAGVPLVAITADRPPELRGCGASQTIDQTRLYGDFVRSAVELSCARDDIESQRALVAAVARAVASAIGPNAGPVHINAPARKPLTALGRMSIATENIPRMIASKAMPCEASLAAVCERLARATRPLVVAGPIAASDRGTAGAIRELADALAAPIFAEATSQLVFAPQRDALIPDFDQLLRTSRFELDAPDVILEFGTPPTSAGYARALGAHPDIWRAAMRPFAPADPARSANHVVVGDLACSAAAILAGIEHRDGQTFLDSWKRRSDPTKRSEASDADATMAGQTAVGAIVATLRNGSQLMIGNSLPIRWLDQTREDISPELDVHSQRGVAGIDGLVAGAAGTADASGRPTCLILGDVSMAHDIGSLSLAAQATTPLIICVLDNRGGQIFSELPYAKELPAETLETFFATVPSVDVETAAASVGIEAATVETREQLVAAVKSARESPRATVVRVKIAKSSPAVLS